MKNALSGVLNKGVDDQVIPANPAHRLGKLAESKDNKEHIDPLTREEVKLLLDTVQAKFPEHYSLCLLLARTGMRIGEALALEWGDIDFAGRFITVRRSVTRRRVSTPKNGKIRRVDMSLQLMQALRAHMTASKRKGFALGLGALPSYVFTNELGGLIGVHNWRNRVFSKALQKEGFREIRIHDLRHTYATLRISKGDNITDVSDQLGHYSVKLTLDVYDHWRPGKKKAEVDGLDDESLHPAAPQMHPELSENKKHLNHLD
jgi:integrase